MLWLSIILIKTTIMTIMVYSLMHMVRSRHRCTYLFSLPIVYVEHMVFAQRGHVLNSLLLFNPGYTPSTLVRWGSACQSYPHPSTSQNQSQKSHPSPLGS